MRGPVTVSGTSVVWNAATAGLGTVKRKHDWRDSPVPLAPATWSGEQVHLPPPLAVSLTLCPCFCLCAFVNALSCCVCVKCKPRTVTNPARARNLLSGTQCTLSQTGRGSMPRCTCSSCWILNPDRKSDPNGKANCGWFVSLKLVMSNLPTALDSSQTAFPPLDLRDLQQLPAFTF